MSQAHLDAISHAIAAQDIAVTRKKQDKSVKQIVATDNGHAILKALGVEAHATLYTSKEIGNGKYKFLASPADLERVNPAMVHLLEQALTLDLSPNNDVGAARGA